ncbi:PAS domain S-box protein [Rubrolithibacter danxiaensis]|uniref:PAS domain S-box protein n=1 Tax=Rubrolithibacter danxiaensis TaxID=3390805 RepID=UPI003BF80DFF
MSTSYQDTSAIFGGVKSPSEGFPSNCIDHVPIAIYTCDKNGFITSYNRAAATLWGKEPVIGKDMWSGSWKIFTPEGNPISLASSPMAKALQEKVSVTGEEIIVERPDGVRRNILPHPVPVFDSFGELTGAVNTLLDITEQKQVEEKQGRLAAIVESSDDVIISKTLQGVITSWNQAAEKLFGYTEQEAVRMNIRMLIPPERIAEEDLIISKVSVGEKVDHFETVRVTKHGKRVPLSLTVSAVKDKNGKIIGASKIARDISERKLSEEKLREHSENLEILNSIGKAISEDLDTQSILQKVTDSTTRLMGAEFGAFFYNTVNENSESYVLYTLSGAPKEAFEEFGMPRNSAVFHTTFSGEGVLRSDDIKKDPRYGKNPPFYGMPKGHLPVVSYLAIPVIAKDGTVIGGLFFGHSQPAKFTDDHEKLLVGVVSQAAIALENAKLLDEVQKLNSKKDEFIGLASHELKTPVTSIKGYLQILQKSLLNEGTYNAFIVKALQQTAKLSNLISDLLDISKIEAGKLPFMFSSFNIVSLTEEILEMMRHESKTHSIEFNSIDSYIEVYADRNRIEQVIINLISNAMKYSPQANRVIVSVRKSNERITFAVQDFGIGIKPEYLDRIFTRFYRVDDLASHISGLGIGLYISHEIINRHKGRMWVESSPGKGSTFYFEIPEKIQEN